MYVRKILIWSVVFMLSVILFSCSNTTSNDTTPPTVIITSPVNNSEIVSGTITEIKADAEDNKGIKNVDFYIDSTKVFSDETSPYSYEWDTSGLLGTYTIYAKAYDTNNNVSTSEIITVKIIETDPPTVIITSPADNSEIISGTITEIRADAEDKKGIKNVDFYINNTKEFSDEASPYSYEWDTSGLLGTYTIYAKAYDTYDNASMSDVISVKIIETDPPNPPTDPSPENNAVSVPTNTTLSWTCTDPDSDTLMYDVYFGTTSSPQLVSTDQTATEFDPGVLDEGVTYYWQIVAKDDQSHSTPGDLWNFTTKENIDIEIVFVQGGTFDMGDYYNEGYENEVPVHSVTLNDYYIGKYEVTHPIYIEFLNDFGVNPDGSYNGKSLIDIGDGGCSVAYNGSEFYFSSTLYAPYEDCPILQTTWYGAVVFCNWLSQKEGLIECYDLTDWSCNFNANGYRLPTEAEWEYAARGGINWTDEYRFSGCQEYSELDNYAWYADNASGKTQPVGTKFPNQLGVYDMSGNVWERCWDWYSINYYSISPSNNPTGPESGTMRVTRGGSWDIFAEYCRVAIRLEQGIEYGYNNFGFRVVKNFTP